MYLHARKSIRVTLSTQTKIWVGFTCALVALFGIGIISEMRLQRWVDDAAWISQTQDALAQLVSVSAALRAVESEQRGYLLTEDPNAEKDFQTEEHIGKTPEELKKIVGDFDAWVIRSGTTVTADA